MKASISQSLLPTKEIEKVKENQTEEIEPKIVINDNLRKSPGMCTSHCTKKGTQG